MALISKEPVMVEIYNNSYAKVGYVWLELTCNKADKISVNARLYKDKADMENSMNLAPMTQMKYVGEIDSNIFDPEMGNKAHELALTVFPEFTVETKKEDE
jgi:hypothetical protein